MNTFVIHFTNSVVLKVSVYLSYFIPKRYVLVPHIVVLSFALSEMGAGEGLSSDALSCASYIVFSFGQVNLPKPTHHFVSIHFLCLM